MPLCNRCNRNKPIAHFAVKKNGSSHKTCVACKDARTKTPFNVSAIEGVCLRHLVRYLTGVLRDQKTIIDDHSRRIQSIEDDMKTYVNLDSMGNVYLPKRPDGLFASTELLREYMDMHMFTDDDYNNLTDMTVGAHESERQVNTKRARKTFLVQLGNYLARRHKAVYGRRAERAKTRIEVGDLVRGHSSIRCVFPPDFVDEVGTFMAGDNTARLRMLCRPI